MRSADIRLSHPLLLHAISANVASRDAHDGRGAFWHELFPTRGVRQRYGTESSARTGEATGRRDVSNHHRGDRKLVIQLLQPPLLFPRA